MATRKIKTMIIEPQKAIQIVPSQRRNGQRRRRQVRNIRNLINRNPAFPNLSLRPASSGRNVVNRYNRRFRRINPFDNDTMSMCKEEKWYDVVIPAPSSNNPSGTTTPQPTLIQNRCQPGASSVSHLDRIGLIFESFRLQNVEIIYRPASSTTLSGQITIGIDYTTGAKRTIDQIPLLQPNRSGPVFNAQRLPLNNDRIMKGRRWLQTASGQTWSKYAGNDDSSTGAIGGVAAGGDQDNNCFTLNVGVSPINVTTATTIGSIWIKYHATFCVARTPVSQSISTNPGVPGGEQPNANIASIALNRARMLAGTIAEAALPSQASSSSSIDDSDWWSVLAPIALGFLALVPNDNAGVKTTIQSKVLESTFNINTNVPLLQKFSVAQTIPPSTRALCVGAPTTEVIFQYPDGSEVPQTVISPDNTAGPLTIRYEDGEGTDLSDNIGEIVGGSYIVNSQPTRDITCTIASKMALDYSILTALGGIPIPEDMFSAVFPGNTMTLDMTNPSQKNGADYMMMAGSLVVHKDSEGVLTFDDFTLQTDAARLAGTKTANTTDQISITPTNGALEFRDGDLFTILVYDSNNNVYGIQNLMDALSANLVLTYSPSEEANAAEVTCSYQSNAESFTNRFTLTLTPTLFQHMGNSGVTTFNIIVSRHYSADQVATVTLDTTMLFEQIVNKQRAALLADRNVKPTEAFRALCEECRCDPTYELLLQLKYGDKFKTIMDDLSLMREIYNI